MPKNKSTPKPSASVMVVRDAANGLEVLMTERPSSMGFAAGALVFPGGKVDEADGHTGFHTFCDAAPEDWPYRLAAIREVFEETGLFLGHARRGGMPGRTALDDHVDFLDFCQKTSPFFIPDDLLYFSRWITPKPMPVRFDTRFYLARAPEGQILIPDPREIVRAEWMRPQDVLECETAGRLCLMFPTRMNLRSLGRFQTVDEAFGKMSREPVVTVEPEVLERDGMVYLKIPPVEGYGLTEVEREDMAEFRRQHGA